MASEARTFGNVDNRLVIILIISQERKHVNLLNMKGVSIELMRFVASLAHDDHVELGV
jgi:hypothetical protein